MGIFSEAFRNAVYFLLVVIGALAIDGALHLAGRPDLGRYFGYWGTGLLIVSFAYSARKRRLFSFGRPPVFLRIHEFLAWFGAMLILVHGGIHYNGLLAWLAMGMMLVNVASGLTGKFLFGKSKAVLSEKKKSLAEGGLSADAVEDRLYWDSLVVGLMQKWRKVHLPITAAFVFLASLHVASVLMFWRW